MSEKSTIDKLFDIADQALSPVEKALTPSEPETIHEAWEEGFKVVHWAHAKRSMGEGGWHAFDEASLTAKCGDEFDSHEITNRQVLEPGRVIPACTACIIAVSK